jgi:hypothetical protein
MDRALTCDEVLRWLNDRIGSPVGFALTSERATVEVLPGVGMMDHTAWVTARGELRFGDWPVRTEGLPQESRGIYQIGDSAHLNLFDLEDFQAVEIAEDDLIMIMVTDSVRLSIYDHPDD